MMSGGVLMCLLEDENHRRRCPESNRSPGLPGIQNDQGGNNVIADVGEATDVACLGFDVHGEGGAVGDGEHPSSGED